MMYEVKGKTTKISATSKTTVKIKDNFYSVELSEEREIPDLPDVALEEERKALFADLNAEVDRQISDIFETFRR